MNQQNVDFLKERLFFLGFGTHLNNDLEKKIGQNEEKFNLTFQAEFGKDTQKKVVDYSVDFTRSKKEDMYFVNNYNATLKNDDPAKEKTQKFYLNKGSGVTAKEAFNLLEGRSVFKNNLVKKPKEGADPTEKPQKYEAWIKLDFSQKEENGNFKPQQYHQKWNYDLEKSLAKHPFKELDNSDKKLEVLRDLKKGDIVPVTYMKDNAERNWFAAANPKDRRVNVYDEKMIEQFQGVRQANTQGKSESQQLGQEGDKQKQDSKKDLKSDDGPREKVKKRKGMSV